MTHLRIRLRLRLRPGPGHATGLELWGRWASFRESGRTRPSLTWWQRARYPQEHSLFLGRAHHRRTVRGLSRGAGGIPGARSHRTSILPPEMTGTPGGRFAPAAPTCSCVPR
ncbi:MAG TPA: hypothetical protein VFQ44_08015 [Streptosporangiaceae bacterium]|nr:hypothetical protein [Streptosporangiaceae bacterium]